MAHIYDFFYLFRQRSSQSTSFWRSSIQVAWRKRKTAIAADGSFSCVTRAFPGIRTYVQRQLLFQLVFSRFAKPAGKRGYGLSPLAQKRFSCRAPTVILLCHLRDF